MKKSFEVNLGGRIFNIDEDAYELLNSYIESLRAGFSQSDSGEEIVADIEARFGELFETRMHEGCARIVDFAMVDEFITRMGRPEDVVDELAEEPLAGADKGENSGYTQQGGAREEWREAMLLGKKFYRDTRNGILGSVFSGLAAFTGWNVWLLRAMGIGAFFLLELLVPIVYIVLWMILPRAKNIVDLMRMREIAPLPGERVEDAWRREYERALVEIKQIPGGDNKGCLAGCVVMLLLLVMIPLILLLAFNGILFSSIFNELLGKSVMFGEELNFASSLMNNMLLCVLLPIIVAIPLFLLVYYIFVKKNKARPLNRWVVIFLSVLCLAAVGLGVAFSKIDKNVNVKVTTNSGTYNINSTSSVQTATSLEALTAFLERVKENSPEFIQQLYDYYKDVAAGVDAGKYNRVLWHHIASQRTDSVIPFVSECVQSDSNVHWTVMPRDEWMEFISTPASVSGIEILGQCGGTAEIYCAIDTANKCLWVDLSRCKGLSSLKIERNSIVGWQTEVVKGGFSLDEHPGCFEMMLKVYGDDCKIEGTPLPKLTLREKITGGVVSNVILQTLYYTLEKE